MSSPDRSNTYARHMHGVDDFPPYLPVCYFHALATNIENALTPVKESSKAGSKPRPLCDIDNKTVEDAWMDQRKSLRYSYLPVLNHRVKTSSGMAEDEQVNNLIDVKSGSYTSLEESQVSQSQTGCDGSRSSPACGSQHVPIGVSKLHKVSLPDLIVTPIYWQPVSDTSPVLRATWFFEDDMLPVHPDIANLLEAGYLKLRPWTTTWQDELKSAIKVGASGEERVIHQLWPRPHTPPAAGRRPMTGDNQHGYVGSEGLPQSRTRSGVTQALQVIEQQEVQTSADNRAIGSLTTDMHTPERKYQSSAVIYVNSREAIILRPSLQPSEYFGRRPLANYISKGRKIGIAVIRGFDRDKYNTLNNVSKDAPHAIDQRTREPLNANRHQSSNDRSARVKEDANPSVSNLILVVHGIGQKMSESVESKNFTRVVNGLRRDINAEITSRVRAQEPRSEIIALPVNWRRQLSFEVTKSSPTADQDASSMFSIADITPVGLPAVRSIISEVMLDIPLYLSNHKPKMIQAVIDEANRIYELWCQNNPSFRSRGRVHLVAHSLGSLMMVDILSQQPTSVKNEPVERQTARQLAFDTQNLILCGSPAGVFIMLERAALLPRRDCRKALIRSPAHLSKVAGEQGTQGCLAVENVYNVVNPYDPVAYNLNAAVDARWAAGLRTAFLPRYSTPWFSFPSFTPFAAEPAVSNEEAPSQLSELPLNVELDLHSFTSEKIAEERVNLLNDNGQVDFLLKYSPGPIGLKYLTMLGAHSSYWVSKDFVQFLVTETLRRPEYEGTCPAMRAVKKKSRA